MNQFGSAKLDLQTEQHQARDIGLSDWCEHSVAKGSEILGLKTQKEAE
jgi:hypothetical protein